ncbi:MAG: hypothetical protein ACM3UL_02445, partial [Ignavibacteria bacterium]
KPYVETMWYNALFAENGSVKTIHSIVKYAKIVFALNTNIIDAQFVVGKSALRAWQLVGYATQLSVQTIQSLVTNVNKASVLTVLLPQDLSERIEFAENVQHDTKRFLDTVLDSGSCCHPMPDGDRT